MADFWPSCGFHLLQRSQDGKLIVTDDYLRAYYSRPELAPVAESCAAETALHAALMDAPRRTVTEADLAAIADEDARENYRVMMRFRERLLAAPTLEAFYFDLFRHAVAVPPDFIHHTAQVILRGILDGAGDGIEATHAEYFRRDERFDTVLALNPGEAGSRALARVIERWIAHFHGIRAQVIPIREIPDAEWRWHVGLDVEATAMLNEIYNGGEVEEARMKRIIALFRTEFLDPSAIRAELAGAPVFLGLAMAEDGVLRMKPQNLLVNLPLARTA